MPSAFKVDVMTHGARVYDLTPDTHAAMTPFLKELELKETVDVFDEKTKQKIPQLQLKKRFYCQREGMNEFFIHKHHLDDFTKFLRENQLLLNSSFYYPRTNDGYPTQFVIDGKSPRDYQQAIIDDLITGDRNTFGVKLATGKGKTFISLFACAELKQRVIVMVLPKYFGIWEKAINEEYKEGTYTTEVVSGSMALKDLMRRGKEGGEVADIVLMSATTYRNYIDAFERWDDENMKAAGYSINPPEFHQTLKFGVQINDEIQDDPGLVFRIDTVSNIKRQFYLSATPYTGNDTLTKMINVMLPKKCDVPLPGDDAYADVRGVVYHDPVKPSEYKGYKGAYSHINYESKLLKNKKRLKHYEEMVKRIVEVGFIKPYQKGQKTLLFFATVKFIDHMTNVLKKAFPGFKVAKYVANVPYNVLQNADIVLTTLKSAGAGVDIPNVKEIHLYHATDSKRDNLQVLGRGRRLKDFPDIPPRFTYMICDQIPQHRRYSNHKKDYFKGKVKSHKILRFN